MLEQVTEAMLRARGAGAGSEQARYRAARTRGRECGLRWTGKCLRTLPITKQMLSGGA